MSSKQHSEQGGALAHVGERKRLRKAAELKYKGRETEWVGGVLYFKGSDTEVPGVARVPKPGCVAQGRPQPVGRTVNQVYLVARQDREPLRGVVRGPGGRFARAS